jgi:apolipoprotein N-acyltransferase
MLGAIATTVLALAWPALRSRLYAGPWPVIDALVVAWGLLHPARKIALYGVLPLTGRHLVWLTIGVTILFALFRGVAPFVPHLLVVAGALAWFGPLRAWRTRRRPGQPGRADAGQGFSFEEWYRKNVERRK